MPRTRRDRPRRQRPDRLPRPQRTGACRSDPAHRVLSARLSLACSVSGARPPGSRGSSPRSPAVTLSARSASSARAWPSPHLRRHAWTGFDVVAPTPMVLPEAVVARSSQIAPSSPAARPSAGDGVKRSSRSTTPRAGASRRGGGWAAMPPTWRSTVTNAARLWAVGYVRTTSLRPLAARKRSSGSWRIVGTPSVRGGGTLTDVAADGSTGTWAVGFTLGEPGRFRPWVLRWDGRRFVDRSPRLRDRRGRTADGRLGRSRGRDVGRGLDAARRRRSPVHRATPRRRLAAPEPCRTSAKPSSPTSTCESAASGGRSDIARLPAACEPLVLRWDAAAWTSIDTSGIADDAALLMGAASMAGGRAMVVGAGWDRSRRRFEGLTARGGHRRLVDEPAHDLSRPDRRGRGRRADSSRAWLARSPAQGRSGCTDVRSVRDRPGSRAAVPRVQGRPATGRQDRDSVGCARE